jgi:hypothetical protein
MGLQMKMNTWEEDMAWKTRVVEQTTFNGTIEWTVQAEMDSHAQVQGSCLQLERKLLRVDSSYLHASAPARVTTLKITHVLMNDFPYML